MCSHAGRKVRVCVLACERETCRTKILKQKHLSRTEISLIITKSKLNQFHSLIKNGNYSKV